MDAPGHGDRRARPPARPVHQRARRRRPRGHARQLRQREARAAPRAEACLGPDQHLPPEPQHRALARGGSMIDTTTIDSKFGVPEHREHRLTTPDGRTLAVAEWGDPNGRPVITFHGTPGSRIGYWTLEPEIWARFGLRRFSFDRPGYGESTRLPGRTVADVVPDVVTIADAFGLRRFAISGGSGGGPHVLACAALIPGRVVRCLASVSVAPF